MLYRKLGSTGLAVSAIGFGGGAISGEGGGYGFGYISEDDAISVVRRAFDAGITLFDTAPIYGFGESERRMGKAIKPFRDRAIIVSKSGVHWNAERKSFISNEPAVTQQMLEESLGRLDVDVIDLYLIHWPDSAVEIRRPMEVLAKAQQAGKIRHIGLSNTHPADLSAACEVAEVAVLQSEFNLFRRENVEQQLFPLCRERQMGFMSWGTLDKGILTGRVSANSTFDKFDSRTTAPWWNKEDRSLKFQAVERLQKFAESIGYSLLEIALGFVLHHPEVSTALFGAKSFDQISSSVAALEHLPSRAIIEQGVAMVGNFEQKKG